MLGLNDHDQAWFVGIRSTFYRIAMIAGQGLLVMLAGFLEERVTGSKGAWTITFLVVSGLFVLIWLYHQRALPRPAGDDRRSVGSFGRLFRETVETFTSFFRKEHVVISLAFFLLYRLAEAQLAKMAQPFLLDDRTAGGLGLSLLEVGFVYGTVGVLSLVAGGILGGLVASRKGLKYWLGWMVLAINAPNLVYVLLSFLLPESYLAVNVAVAIEQFGYGFGFTAYMLYMIYFARGPRRTAHFAICTGFMALGMMLPGMVSGWIQESIGYPMFFIWVMIATVPGIWLTFRLPVDPEFGKKHPDAADA
jgi:PAT family beta-lactamase induction signal transducer AmpG